MTLLFVIIPASLSLVYFCIIIFLRAGLRRLSIPSNTPNNLTFSVVIAAHNEEQNIEKCMTSVLSQTIGLARYEVILVNDRSSDATAKIAGAIAGRYSNVSVITVDQTPPGMSPKKYAVGQGIAAARNEIIVFTDADCVVPATWLETIDRYLDEKTGLVQGITAYEYVPGMNQLFFGLQAVDFLSHGVVAAAAIGAGLPLNSNANNFAFRKKAFDDAQGYGEQAAVVSGDDDLLLQRIWRSGKWRIRYMADNDGKVGTRPTPTLRSLFEQRKRWGSKTVHYRAKQVCLLSSVFLFYTVTAATFCAGFFSPGAFAACGGMLLVKVLGEAVLMIPGARLFGEKRLLKFLALASLIQLPVVLAAVALGVFGRFSWKGKRFSRKSR
jgi:cellulose synthase/poly-beta-1,6-N-acetylglucosamine synthase-like glycosyltransferase